MIINGITYRSGDTISCYIRDTHITDAKIYIRESSVGSMESTSRAWICHNHSEHDGDRSDEMFGYRYSWCFHLKLGKPNSDVTNIYKFYSDLERKSCIISENLSKFFLINQLKNVEVLFTHKIGIFNEFNKYDFSKEEGILQLQSTENNKKVDIKFGRFIRQMSNKFNEQCQTKIELTDSMVEDLQNKFVSYQKGDQVQLIFLKGKDILDGYKKENYFGLGKVPPNTLHKSCMSDTNYISLYTENPDQVELAVIMLDNKVAARCLVWTTTKGIRAFDRVYYAYDWLEKTMEEGLVKSGLTPLKNIVMAEISLKYWKFDTYPYLDSFYYFNMEEGCLYYFGGGCGLKTLRNTNGTYGG